MRFYEALKEAQENGKKIRIKDWDKPSYVYYYHEENKLGAFYSEMKNFYHFRASDILRDWEIYEEQKEPEKLYQWATKKGSAAWKVSPLVLSSIEAEIMFEDENVYIKLDDLLKTSRCVMEVER